MNVLASREKVLLVVLALAGGLFILSRTKRGSDLATDWIGGVVSSVRGIRLHNPLNVERGQPWDGLADDQPDDRFANFVSDAYGVRAWHRIMQTYRTKYGIKTVAGIVNRYNPPEDGQPESYIPNVAEAIGVDPNDAINIMDRQTAFALARAMMSEEVGSVAAALVSDASVNQGLSMAGVA